MRALSSAGSVKTMDWEKLGEVEGDNDTHDAFLLVLPVQGDHLACHAWVGGGARMRDAGGGGQGLFEI